MKSREIAILGHTAAAGGDHQTGLFSQTVQCGCLPLTECFLSILRENLGDRLARGFDDFSVGIHEFSSQTLGQRRADGALSAARHTDENQIFHLV